MVTVAAIWHNPGGPNRAGAGDYPVVILGFQPPGMSLGLPFAIAVDTAGRLWSIAFEQLTVRDEHVLGKLTSAAGHVGAAPQ